MRGDIERSSKRSALMEPKWFILERERLETKRLTNRYSGLKSSTDDSASATQLPGRIRREVF